MVFYAHYHADNMKLNNNELLNITGGSIFSATLLNAFSRSLSILLESGRYVGSAIRMWFSGKKCSM